MHLWRRYLSVDCKPDHNRQVSRIAIDPFHYTRRKVRREPKEGTTRDLRQPKILHQERDLP